MNCGVVQTEDDVNLESDEVITFSAFSDDSAITEIQPSGGQIGVQDNDSKLNLIISSLA